MANSDNKINISDSWKGINTIQINIGDDWKDVSEAYINIGDVWKKFWIVGDRGIFAGGVTTVATKTIDYITISTTGNATDFGDLTVPKVGMTGTSNGTNGRGIFAGGQNSTPTDLDVIDYITILSPGTATDFGNLTAIKRYPAGSSNGTNERGVSGGGYATVGPIRFDVIEYITISNTGNATNFGDLTTSRSTISATSNGTNDRGVWGGGYAPGTVSDIIDYITISNTGNATDFGNLTVARYYSASTSNTTNERGVFAGGVSSTDVIDYITINSASNATDFGNLLSADNRVAPTSNGTNERGVFGGDASSSNVIQYITISTTGNATDFGDLTVGRYGAGGASNAS